MVLTVQASEVAACAGDRKARGARMEVVERLLLNRVDGQRTRFAVDLTDEHSILIASAAANARLAICNLAMVRTELTLYLSIFQPLIIPALHQNTIAS